MEHRSFTDIERLTSQVTITEKIHGTNAQILIQEVSVNELHGGRSIFVDDEQGGKQYIVRAGSRTRWITPEDDNFGFAAWVYDNANALLTTLGLGIHYGEWWGSGINSGYNLTKGEKRFSLFNQNFAGRDLSAVTGLGVVPVLYRGAWRDGLVTEVMTQLKLNGSSASPGFMRPEGVVVRFERNGAMFKNVFEAEETAWTGKPKVAKPQGPHVDQELVNKLLQPIRLEKLLSRDEAYLVNYPKSLPDIVKAYSADLEKEGQFEGVDPAVMKAARKQFFPWVCDVMNEKGYSR